MATLLADLLSFHSTNSYVIVKFKSTTMIAEEQMPKEEETKERFVLPG